MPVASITVARDEMLAVLKTAWDANDATIPLFYWDRKQDPPTSDKPYAKVTIQHATGGQATLANASGQKKWRRTGVITVQIFTLFGQGLSDADILSKVVQDAFDGTTTTSGIWFRNVTVNEIGQDGDRFQTNVLIDFEYDEIK